MSTADIITKIDLYFNDGSMMTLVGQERFLAIRDALKVQSQANDMLCKQAELMEDKIRELEAKCKSLEDMTHELIAQLNTDIEFVQFDEFKNPLP